MSDFAFMQADILIQVSKATVEAETNTLLLFGVVVVFILCNAPTGPGENLLAVAFVTWTIMIASLLGECVSCFSITTLILHGIQEALTILFLFLCVFNCFSIMPINNFIQTRKADAFVHGKIFSIGFCAISSGVSHLTLALSHVGEGGNTLGVLRASTTRTCFALIS
jgi:hypothetical protein